MQLIKFSSAHVSPYPWDYTVNGRLINNIYTIALDTTLFILSHFLDIEMTFYCISFIDFTDLVGGNESTEIVTMRRMRPRALLTNQIAEASLRRTCILEDYQDEM